MEPLLSTWDRMTPLQRISAVNVDVMGHKQFCTLSGAAMMGRTDIQEGLSTAGTNGRDIFYGPEFVMRLTRRQLRYVHIHEATHIALRHCLEYEDLVKKYPRESNMAMDYVVNAFIEEIDPERKWAAHPSGVTPLLDAKYFGWSFLEVLHDLKQNPPPEDADPMDEHMSGDGSATGQMADSDAKAVEQAIDDAMRQGAIAAQKIAGKGKGNNPLEKSLHKRDTNWKQHLREFFEQIVQGDEYSRFCPPNKRMLA